MLNQAKYKMKPPMSARLMPGHPLAEGLVGFWPMLRKSSTQVFDLSGNGNTGTFVNSPTWVPGKFGSAINFVEASSQYISMGDCLNDLTVPFTFITYFKVVDTDVHGFVDTDNRLNFFVGFYLYLDGNDVKAHYGDNTGGSAGNRRSAITTDNPISNNTYYHLAVVCRGAQDWSIYVDGISHTPAYSGTGGAMVHTSDPLTIGLITTAATYYHDGNIDYGMFYNRALASSEIAQLYREPFCMFDWEWLPARVAANGDVLVTPDPASAVAAKVDPTVSLGGITVSPSPASAVAASSSLGWIGISSANIDSLCGENVVWTLAKALDGTGYWAHEIDETPHSFILDLLVPYDVQKVRSRSNTASDPTNVNIYINNTGEAPWGDAVASGITTWQDNVEWVEIDTTPKEGRYVYVEITTVEAVSGFIYYGHLTVPFTIFDVYESSIFDPTVVLGSLTISPTPASAVAATVAPTVECGSLTIEPAEASAIAVAIDPTVESGLLNITPSSAYVIATKVDPTVVLGSQTIEPTPATAVADAIGPYFADEGNAILFGANF